MEKNNLLWKNLLIKISIVAVLALLMLIPLNMVRNQVNERSHNHTETIGDITKSWGTSQIFTGPWISYKYTVGNEKEKETVKAAVFPDNLKYDVKTTTQVLHRSIYDVPVYTAELTITGSFILDDKLPGIGTADLILNMDDLKGIQGNPTFILGGKDLKVKSGDKGLKSEITLDNAAKEGDALPFRVVMKINGSESLFFKPVGSLTEVVMSSDYPSPSFGGDFLPVERDVREDGFTAKWLISQITMASPSANSFGVRLVKPVTQYRQTERATKYGLLIIFLVFIAGFVVEIISKKPINIIQYLIIGASLVLFYSLLLAFSDFLSFGVSYLIASVMTTAALGGYFVGIVKNKWAYLLTGLVALAYGIIYVLLQMETFAFLAGTLLLFIILCIIMFLTRNLKIGDPRLVPAKEENAEADE